MLPPVPYILGSCIYLVQVLHSYPWLDTTWKIWWDGKARISLVLRGACCLRGILEVVCWNWGCEKLCVGVYVYTYGKKSPRSCWLLCPSVHRDVPTKKFDQNLVKIKTLKSLNLELHKQSKGSQTVFEGSTPLLCILGFIFFLCLCMLVFSWWRWEEWLHFVCFWSLTTSEGQLRAEERKNFATKTFSYIMLFYSKLFGSCSTSSMLPDRRYC